ncbi:MAG: glycosyltransferase family protein [Nostoc sp.]|uniref:glycosyltransferase family protein n=1 Tax=Nostoc sp. TaxID=1180 RepID=UPI002FF4C889
MNRVIATIEARMGSSRLPGKVLKEAVGKPMLLLMVERVRRARYIDEVVVATTTNEKDEAIASLCSKHNIPYFRGSEENVLERVVETGRHYQAEVSVLLTGDCPLIDPYVIDQHICAFFAAYPHVDYVANCEVRSYPHGLDLMVLSWKTLAQTVDFASSEPFREHVGWYIRRHPEQYRRLDIIAPPGLSNPFFRITLDYQEDYHRIKAIFEALYPQNPQFTTVDILNYAQQQGWIDF